MSLPRNCVDEIAVVARQHSCALLVDAMSSFAVLDVHADRWAATCVAFSSNKGLQGVPGLGFCIVRAGELTVQPARTLTLDLGAQDKSLKETGEWRFTPPTHVMLALREALDELGFEPKTWRMSLFVPSSVRERRSLELSRAGNRTPVLSVTAIDTNHYTTRDFAGAAAPLGRVSRCAALHGAASSQVRSGN